MSEETSLPEFDSGEFDDDALSPEFEDNVAPEGMYDLRVFGQPKARISRGEKTKGQVFLVWRLDHVGENKKFGSHFENTMLKPPGSFKLHRLLVSLGLSKDQAKNFRPKPRTAISVDDDKGVECDCLVNGEPWDPAGIELRAYMNVEESDEYGKQNRIKKFA